MFKYIKVVQRIGEAIGSIHIRLEKYYIVVERPDRNGLFFENTADLPGNISYYSLLNNLKVLVYGLYCYLYIQLPIYQCINISISLSIGTQLI